MTYPDDTHDPPKLVSAAVLSGLVMYAALQLVAAWRAGLVFEYPLDDVYIHLAMASEIARGGYGVNAGEPASAASSALYPVLLTLFPDTGLQRLLPLFWNIVGLVLIAWLWARALIWAGYRGVVGWLLALSVPLLSGAVTTAYVGMEHTLHAAASMAIVFGLAKFVVEDRVTPVLALGLLFSPLLRFEGLALCTMAIAMLALHRRPAAAIAAAILSFVPIGIFVYYLTTLGLDPMPNSVQAKLNTAEDIDTGILERTYWTVLINLSKWGGRAILAFVVAAVLIRALSSTMKDSRWSMFVVTLAAAGLGHIALGQIGWMERYEHYAIAALGLGVVIMAAYSADAPRLSTALAVLAVGFGGWFYVKQVIYEHPWGSRAIHFQQSQMASFAKDHLGRNVAVNDIGWVSWANPNYVLDLFGLANDEARRLRLHDPKPGWAGPLVAESEVSVIMIYENWMEEAISPDWIRLGRLRMKNPRGFLGYPEVHFYAANQQELPYAQAALSSWVPTLVADTCFVPEGVEQCPN